MTTTRIPLTDTAADGFVIPLGAVNLVFAKTGEGMIACGAFDVMALDKFGYPAAKMRSAGGGPIATVDDLLNGKVREVNEHAASRGVRVEMKGREALDLL